MKRPTCLAVIAFAWFLAAAAEAATLTRGPYLQLSTESSIVVRWRTDAASDSRVSYGPAPGNLTSFADDATLVTEHVVTVSGLAPDTVYYYSIGTTTETLAGDDANHFFLTSPTPGTPKPTRVWVLGDSGTADANAMAVRNAYYGFTGSRHTDLWLMLGDNAYSSGTDAQYQAAVFNMYPEMLRKSVLWPTLGNHDGSAADSATQSGPYYEIFSLPRNAEAGGIASGTEAYYSFDHGNIHFIVLDSFETDRSPGGAMMTWLANDLAATTQDWIIAYWHHPPYSKGFHDSDANARQTQMRQYALPILEDNGVDLVLAGHSHSYERSFLIDGHYGTSDTLQPGMILDGGDGREAGDGAYQKHSSGPAPHQGAVYTVAGNSGHTGTQGTLNHPVMFYSVSILGSVVLDVQGNRLDASLLDSTGLVRDTYTIVKGCEGVTTVAVSPASASVEVGATLPLTATPRDAGGAPLSGCAVSWSSSPSAVVAVSSSGLVTGVAEGSATVTATVEGASGEAAITVVASTNTPPAVNAGSDLVGSEGAGVTLSASFGDPDAGDVHTATIDWGDGSAFQPGTVDQATDTVTASHVYANDGVYPVTVTVNDGRTGVGQDTAAAAVSNVSPSPEAGGPYLAVTGPPLTLSGSASDPGADVLAFEWDFDYDGAFQADATGTTVQHTYTEARVYSVALRVWDDDVSVLATTTASVTDQPAVVMYLSLGSDMTLPGGLSAANEDILAFDGSGFSLYFDGSDVGLQAFAIDAFSVLSATEILVSFTSPGTVGGVAMDDSDVLLFTASSLGAATAGTFSMYFDGSDVGLSTSGEDLDAFELLADGRLLVSTTNTAAVPEGFSVEDEDLLVFTPTSLGTVTAGSWALYFDGGDVLLANSAEDVDALAVDASGRIHLSTTGNFAVAGVSGADEDVFVFTPTSLGSTTQGTFAPSLFFDGSSHGLAANDVFAIDLP